MNIGELAKFRGGVSADTISELTSASGVTIDGMVVKDGGATVTNTASYQTTVDQSTTSFRIGRAAVGTTAINIYSPNTSSVLGGFTDALVDLNLGSAGSVRINRSSPAGSQFVVYQSGTTTINFQVTDTSVNTGVPATIGNANYTGVALSTSVAAKLRTSSNQYTDSTTAASGTVAHGTIVSFDNPAIAATNGSVTYTNASTLYIDGAPTAGSNVTITNPYALYINGGKTFHTSALTVSTVNQNMQDQRSTFTMSESGGLILVGTREVYSIDQSSFNLTLAFTSNGGGSRGNYTTVETTGSGTITGATCYSADIINLGSGTITNACGFFSDDPSNSGGGAITNYFGFYQEAITVGTTSYAFYANNAASGTARYNFYANGTAPNVFNGAIVNPRTTLTASATGAGAITVINNYHAVSGAGGAASTITTINGGIDGMMVVLKAVSDTVDIVFDTGGNLLLAGGAAFTLDTLNDTITFMYDSSLTKWLEIARSNNA